MKIIVIGSSGSIGRKHLANLKLLGYEADTCDPNDPNATYKNIYDIGFNGGRYDLAVCCTPADDHFEHLHCLNDRGFPYILMEKPLYVYPTGSQLCVEARVPVTHRELKSEIYINHAYRFDNGYRKLKELLPMVGEVRYAYIENAYSFKKLHPDYTWEEYPGIIYDDSHIVNISRFLFGDPAEVRFKDVHKGLAMFLWKTDKHLVLHNTNIMNEVYRKRVEVVGEKGNLVYNYGSHHIYFCPADETERIAIAYDHQSHLFEALKYVLEVVKNKGKFEVNNIFDALKDMEIIEGLVKCGKSS